MTIYTIGHSRRDIEDFIIIMKKYKIGYLVDVRSTPYSYFSQYNREQLQRYLSDVGIKYVYMGDVLEGRPKDPACYNNGIVYIKNINYRKYELTELYQRSIEKFIKASKRKEEPVCIMCSEKNPYICHRHNLIAKTLVEKSIEVQHIIDKDEISFKPIYNDGIQKKTKILDEDM